DKDGIVIGGGGGFKEEILTAEWAELYAFEESLKIVWSLNITTAVFETDNASLNEIQKIMDKFHSAIICWANRSCN
ncbi:hypothetical protein Goklo_017172, partial [Gossypium klotzschianum]|nr:hypothetical protein [Gossypium klotzschianum]